MQLWDLMGQVKVHYQIFYQEKKGYEIEGAVDFNNENLLNFHFLNILQIQ